MNDPIPFIDLCCGIGGFRVGIDEFVKNSNKLFKCVLSADIKQDALDTYNANFGESNTKTDINTLTDLPPFDLLVAGFPCQPFSTAGHQKGFEDHRGGIIFTIRNICKKHRPECFILENVANLLNMLHNGKRVIETIQEMFEEIGYNISFKRLNSMDFGIPQLRQRVFIVGNLHRKIDLENIQTQPMPKLKDIIDTSFQETDLPQQFVEQLLNYHKTVKPIYGMRIRDNRRSNMNIHSWDIDFHGSVSQQEKDLMNKIMTERSKKYWAINKGIEHFDGMPLTVEEIKTFFDVPNLQEMLDNLSQKGYLKFQKCKDRENGRRVFTDKCQPGYNICKGMLSFPLMKVLDPEGFTPTLTATDSIKLGVLVGNTVRKLTINEMKAVCGFPQDFQVPEHVNAYNLFGNMATPPVITAIMTAIYSVEPPHKRRKV